MKYEKNEDEIHQIAKKVATFIITLKTANGKVLE